MRRARLEWMLIVVGIVLSAPGCESLAAAMEEMDREFQAANAAAPTKVCPKCGQRFERQAFTFLCPADGTALSSLSPSSPQTGITATGDSGGGDSLSVPAASAAPDFHVVVIHGTTYEPSIGWTLADKSEMRWTDPDVEGSFADRLRNRLTENRPDRRVHVHPFEWHGWNDNVDRHNAAVRLARRLDALPVDAEVHVVGHSHGGSVALHGASMAGRKPASITTIATPVLGATLRNNQNGREWFLPVYVPPPDQIPGVRIHVVYSPEDSVSRDGAFAWASTTNLEPGDNKFSQLREWRRYYDIGTGPGRHVNLAGERKWQWLFDGRDNIMPQALDPRIWPTASNAEVRADAGLFDKKWVHSALHCSAMGAAVADMIVGSPADEAVQRHGLQLLPRNCDHGQ